MGARACVTYFIKKGVSDMGKREKIADYIEDLIKGGRLKKGDKIPSEYMLAEMFSVNNKTANLAVSNLVAKGFLKRLSGAAGTIVQKDSLFPKGVFAYLINIGQWFNYSAKLLHGAQHAAFIRGYALQYVECDGSELNETLVKLADFGIKGLLATHYGLIENKCPFPVLHVDFIPPEGSLLHYVTNDNFKAGYLATRHLLDLKHRDLVLVVQSSNFNNPGIKERLKGFVHALEEDEIPDAKDRIICSNFNFPSTLKEIKTKYPGFTAIVYDSDVIAVKMLDFLLKNGFRIPEDLSIVGSGGTLTKDMPTLKITSVEQFPNDMGFFALNALADLVEGKRTAMIAENFPVELYNGESTKTITQR
jgi:DNA-binding LacI/PurR family transcriptional regulator